MEAPEDPAILPIRAEADLTTNKTAILVIMVAVVIKGTTETKATMAEILVSGYLTEITEQQTAGAMEIVAGLLVAVTTDLPPTVVTLEITAALVEIMAVEMLDEPTEPERGPEVTTGPAEVVVATAWLEDPVVVTMEHLEETMVPVQALVDLMDRTLAVLVILGTLALLMGAGQAVATV